MFLKWPNIGIFTYGVYASKIRIPHVKNYLKPPKKEILILGELAYWKPPHKISTSSAVDFHKMLHEHLRALLSIRVV